MTNERKRATSRPAKAPPKPVAKDSSEKLVTREDLDEIFTNGKPELTQEERETIDRYYLQKGFRDDTEEMIGKTSIYVR
mgnify:CR=1 FL=1